MKIKKVAFSIDDKDLEQAQAMVAEQGKTLNDIASDFIKTYIEERKPCVRNSEQTTKRLLQKAEDLSSYGGRA
jgi:CHASE3 domain sensor protein